MESKEAANIIRFNLIDRGGCDSFSSKEIEALNMAAAVLDSVTEIKEIPEDYVFRLPEGDEK